jgi:dTDP-4-dehydrorhamnose reductase
VKIALIGVDGQLGTDINVHFNSKGLDVSGLVGLKDIDVCDYRMSENVLKEVKPDLVINTAAFHDVDRCEEEALSALRVNVIGIKNLAVICRKMGVPLMHFSTDYIFDGKKKEPYTENDRACPISMYGISKLAGEQFMQYMLEKYYIVRLSGLYGLTDCVGKKGGNFVEQMIKLARKNKQIKVVDDQVLTPTSTRDVAEKLLELIQTEKYGIYHMTNTDSCSWYEFALEIFKLMDLNVVVQPTTTEEFGAKARRPEYSVLDNANLRKIGLKDLRSWKEALKDYIESRKR